MEWEDFGVSLFFLVAAAGEGIASCAFLDRLRFSDFRQRRDLERARDDLKALDREKSRFTANVHHELRTPLTLMLAPLEAMLGGEFGAVSDGQRSYLRTMHSNALRLLKLINNLLDLAKIESKQLTIRRRPTRVGERWWRIWSTARGRWPSARASCSRRAASTRSRSSTSTRTRSRR